MVLNKGIMFLRVVLVLFLGGFSFVYGQNKLLSSSFWKTATPAQVQAQIKGADINAKDKDANTPLMRACWSENPDIEIIKYLVNAGADVNAKNKDGWAVLMLACLRNLDIEIIKYLINTGANVNTKNKYANTPLMTACGQDNSDMSIIKYLINKGADINAKITGDGHR